MKAGRIVIIALSVPLACILILLVALLVLSPGKPRPMRVAGGISEKIHVDINGVEQGMFIRGKNLANPVLLFLHGGTGLPEYFLAEKYPPGLEDYFTVCWWERRGAGLSYSPNIPPETITVEQMVSDTIAVTNYLRDRFQQEKIWLMAHCGGSPIAIQAAARAPELYHAYIAVAQMSYQLESEVLAYEYMLKRFQEMGNTKMTRKLEEAPVTMKVPLPPSYMAVRDPAMHTLGIGTMHDMKSVMSGVFLASWLCREYTLKEKLNLWRGKFLCDRLLWDTIIATDLTKQVTKLDVPVYFFHGKYDYTVVYSQARSYFEMLEAPLKGFYTFEQSAHSPLYEEPERMRKIFQEDILIGGNNHADAK